MVGSLDHPHWTDAAPSPVFGTVIEATGPAGNVFVILGRATNHLRALAVPEDRVERLRADVTTSSSYNAAVAHVERWFRVALD